MGYPQEVKGLTVLTALTLACSCAQAGDERVLFSGTRELTQTGAWIEIRSAKEGSCRVHTAIRADGNSIGGTGVGSGHPSCPQETPGSRVLGHIRGEARFSTVEKVLSRTRVKIDFPLKPPCNVAIAVDVDRDRTT